MRLCCDSNEVHTSFSKLLLLLLFCFGSTAASLATEDLGYANVTHEHVLWPTPEELVKGLRSRNEQARTSALNLMGIGDQAMPSSIPERVDLIYAPIGNDADSQAIITVGDGPYAWGAVATRQNQKWVRIAAFSCWCKYDLNAVPGNFVQVQEGADRRPELVIHASGGGSGVYNQDEAHFRVINGELRSVLHFVSRQRNCALTSGGSNKCELTRRWFSFPATDSPLEGVLAEAHATYDGSDQIDFTIRDMELRHVNSLSCSRYRWDTQAFRYQRVGEPRKCQSDSNPH